MEKINKSKSYILPLLNDFVEIKNVNDIDNTYLFLEGSDKEYIIVKYKKTTETFEYLNSIKGNDLLAEVRETDNNLYLFFNVPDEIRNDYYHFINGKFSKIYNKNKIISFLSKNYTSRHFNTIQRIKQVLFKDRALKAEIEYNLDITLPDDSELSSKPIKEMETLQNEYMGTI